MLTKVIWINTQFTIKNSLDNGDNVLNFQFVHLFKIIYVTPNNKTMCFFTSNQRKKIVDGLTAG